LNTLFATPMRMVAIAVRLAMDPATYAAGMRGLGGANDGPGEGPTRSPRRPRFRGIEGTPMTSRVGSGSLSARRAARRAPR
jgi:hypothetical protein